MRLGQLARKLDISPTEIERYLYSNGTFIESGSNSKLEDAAVHRVIVHFAPHLMAEVNRELEAEHAEEQAQSTPVAPAEQAEQAVSETITAPHAETTPATLEEKPEVIKAPKIELQGLKVLGKIELPEPKKKPEPVREERPRDRQRVERREDRGDRPWVNKLEQQRQREAREAEARKKEEARQRKELRALAYYNRQSKGPGKGKTRHREAAEDTAPQQPARKTEPPRTFFGKVWRWLTQAE